MATQALSSISLPLQTHQQQQNPTQKLNPQSRIKTPSKPTPDSRSFSSWLEELRSHSRSNNFHEAISVYVNMTSSGHRHDSLAIPVVLKAVTQTEDFGLGKQVHGAAVKLGYESSVVMVANTLLNMYRKCGELADVLKVFDRITERDQVSWNSLIASLCGFEEWELAVDKFREMQLDGRKPNSYSLVSVALACSNLERRRGVNLGKQVHGYSLRSGESKTFTNNSLMSMYAKLRRIEDAISLFEMFDGKNTVSWNSMISSLSQNDKFKEALTCFRRMVLDGMKPDAVTMASVLPACAQLELLDYGKEIHAYAIRNSDWIESSFAGSALVDMYCNCKQVEIGRRVFDRIINRSAAVWNAMLSGYTRHGSYDDALMLFFEMLEFSGISPTPITFSSVIPASVHSEAFRDKQGLHGYVVKLGFDRDTYVQNALIDLYARMGKIDVARDIFNSIETKDIVSWNSMITGYVVCGYHEDALNLIRKMQQSEETTIKNGGNDAGIRIFKPNLITLMAILPSGASVAALSKGKEIHAYAIRNLMASDIGVGSALVDMYAKCGYLIWARRVFDAMPVRNVITWNLMMMAYGMHGKGEDALKLLNSMGNVKPNEVTFITILAACSHSGMVSEGRDLFNRMKVDYGIEPTEDHYGCVVDLLGRAGQLDEAYEFVNTMPIRFNKVGAWSSLLGACWIHQNVELGEIAANHLLQLEPDVASHYVLLSNIYSSAGFWEKATEVRKNMVKRGVKKEPGSSWIEYNDKVHKFVAGDASHPESEKLRGFLESLSERLKKEGYVPDTSCVLHNVNEEEKENLLCGHSERLAIAFGILNIPPGVPIRVSKNLRVCNDCHSATKLISKVVEREIIVRDVRRFHHFKDGICSCGDYW